MIMDVRAGTRGASESEGSDGDFYNAGGTY